MTELTEYRIEYSIQEREPGAEDFEEIGFGSSGDWGSIDAAVHMVASAVRNGEWEVPHE